MSWLIVWWVGVDMLVSSVHFQRLCTVVIVRERVVNVMESVMYIDIAAFGRFGGRCEVHIFKIAKNLGYVRIT